MKLLYIIILNARSKNSVVNEFERLNRKCSTLLIKLNETFFVTIQRNKSVFIESILRDPIFFINPSLMYIFIHYNIFYNARKDYII